MTRILIEVCVDSVESSLAAIRGGADRLEVCGNLGLGGGITPSIGLVQCIQKACPGIPLMVMVRPRTGDFCYSGAELEVMCQDINTFKDAGVAGVVFGVLKSDASVDLLSTRRLVHAASSLQVCFHRAFDMTRNALEALEDIASVPEITRVLTSGQAKSAPTALSALADYHDLTATLTRGRSAPLVILPGSGIGERTIGAVLEALIPHGLTEVHLSGGAWKEGSMTHRPEGMGMGVGGLGEWGVWMTSEQAVATVRRAVDDACY